MKKQIVLSGIQPSGNLTIGNYIGAMRNWIKMLDEYNCLFTIVDMHAITVTQDPEDLLNRCYKFMALYIACGIDPSKCHIFIQSHVPGHAQLCWILNCYTYMGELNRMTQFKDKESRHSKNVNVGLYDYPALMAADILLYNTDLVPVGADQKQHLELTRNVAQRFNSLHGDVFTIPEPYIPPTGSRIMSLQNPTSKMSKSDENSNNYIAILDPPDVVYNKLKKSVTDSGSEIKFDEDKKPAISNLMTIYCVITSKTFSEIENLFSGKNYSVFKDSVAEAVIEFLKPIQVEYKKLSNDKTYLNSILKEGADYANTLSHEMINKVYKSVGFIPKSQ